MKTPQKIGLLLLAVAFAIWIKAAPGQPTTTNKPKYEYWVAHDIISVVAPGMEARLNQGFEIDRLEVGPIPPGGNAPYFVVVLKRER